MNKDFVVVDFLLLFVREKKRERGRERTSKLLFLLFITSISAHLIYLYLFTKDVHHKMLTT